MEGEICEARRKFGLLGKILRRAARDPARMFAQIEERDGEIGGSDPSHVDLSYSGGMAVAHKCVCVVAADLIAREISDGSLIGVYDRRWGNMIVLCPRIPFAADVGLDFDREIGSLTAPLDKICDQISGWVDLMHANRSAIGEPNPLRAPCPSSGIRRRIYPLGDLVARLSGLRDDGSWALPTDGIAWEELRTASKKCRGKIHEISVVKAEILLGLVYLARVAIDLGALGDAFGTQARIECVLRSCEVLRSSWEGEPLPFVDEVHKAISGLRRS